MHLSEQLLFAAVERVPASPPDVYVPKLSFQACLGTNDSVYLFGPFSLCSSNCLLACGFQMLLV